MKNDSIKRRDSKGRILRNGESQAPDGRYRYSYYVNGKQKNLYSWKLELHDTSWKKAVQIAPGTGKGAAAAAVSGDPTGKYDGNGVNRTLCKNPGCIPEKNNSGRT